MVDPFVGDGDDFLRLDDQGAGLVLRVVGMAARDEECESRVS